MLMKLLLEPWRLSVALVALVVPAPRKQAQLVVLVVWLRFLTSALQLEATCP
jgi:hypothetical protein